MTSTFATQTAAEQSAAVLILRTCSADMTSFGGFHWPASGPVEAPDWSPEPECGQGLHGLLWGCGSSGFLNAHDDARWLVVAVDPTSIVDLGGVVKFPGGEVVHVGDRDSAIAYLDVHGAATMPVVYAHRTAGDYDTATAGDYGIATAGYHGTATAGEHGTATVGVSGTATAGYSGTATAGDSGIATAGYYGTATAGEHGTATAGYCGTATAGDGGAATAGNSGAATAGYSGTATVGYYGTATAGYRGTATAGDSGTATAGDGGTATAGDRGSVHIAWWDGRRRRWAVGYVGEDGIAANVAYRVVDGRLVAIDD